MIAEKDVVENEKGGFQLFESDEEPDFSSNDGVVLDGDGINLVANQNEYQDMELTALDNKEEEEKEDDEEMG